MLFIFMLTFVLLGLYIYGSRWPDAGIMLAHRLRRCAHISPESVQRIRFQASSQQI